jgi:NADP-dependent 3-hydroxy acid dehydrogenase YdfG
MVSKLVAMTTALNGSPAGRVAIVTGASRGIGQATSRLLAARGYAVVVNYFHDQLALELRERNITVNAVSVEVHKPCAPNQVADVIGYLLSEHGQGLTGQVLRVGDPRLPASGAAGRRRGVLR